jgi:hypothetical protein
VSPCHMRREVCVLRGRIWSPLVRCKAVASLTNSLVWAHRCRSLRGAAQYTHFLDAILHLWARYWLRRRRLLGFFSASNRSYSFFSSPPLSPSLLPL